MTMLESFAALFDSANILTVCLWVTGVVLFSAELFQPMRGVSYILGMSLLLTAFVTHMMHGSPGEAFWFVLLTASVIQIIHYISLATQKRDWLRAARMTRAGVRNRKYSSLVGRIGVANTSIAFTGSVTVDDVNLVVYSETPIPPGSRVRITDVTPDKIIVELAGSDT